MSIPAQRLSIVLAVVFAAVSGGVESVAPAPSLQPLVVIGASASAGFTMSEPFGGPKTPQYQLSRYLDAALVKSGRPAMNLALTPFFLNPDEVGKQQIDRAVELQPGTVIGVDFLFWFCYGRAQSEADRPKRFEKGLAFLERLNCPMVVGDIPDASAAVGGMLDRSAMPTLETIAAANKRLGEWAASRPNVVVLSLSNFMSASQANRGLTVGRLTWAEGQTGKLLQSDKLHPARHGCAALALAVMDALATQARVLSEADVSWDADEIYRKVTETPGATEKPDAAPAAATPAGF